jgi:hypothetical protein
MSPYFEGTAALTNLTLFVRQVEGESALQMLMPKRRAPKGRVLKPRKAPKRRKAGSDSDDSSSGADGVPRQARRRKAKQAKELAHYTSAAWIEVHLLLPGGFTLARTDEAFHRPGLGR